MQDPTKGIKMEINKNRKNNSNSNSFIKNVKDKDMRKAEKIFYKICCTKLFNWVSAKIQKRFSRDWVSEFQSEGKINSPLKHKNKKNTTCSWPYNWLYRRHLFMGLQPGFQSGEWWSKLVLWRWYISWFVTAHANRNHVDTMVLTLDVSSFHIAHQR